MKAEFKGKTVWAEVTPDGRLKVDGGRVPIRYSKSAGTRIYRAGLSGILVKDRSLVDLPAGTAATQGGGRGGGGSGGRGSSGSGFGKAGTRTQAQAQAAKSAADDLIRSFSPDAAQCFTDGACRGNPGPAGAGAVVKLPGGEVMERHAALGVATNNVGELTAVKLALDLLNEAGFPVDAPAEILTDSKYTYGLLVLGWKAKANQELVARCRRALQERKARLHWIAGHVGVVENERADALANLGVEESASSAT